MAAAKKQKSGSSRKSTGTKPRSSSSSTKKKTGSSRASSSSTRKKTQNSAANQPQNEGFRLTRRMAGLLLCLLALLLALSLYGLDGFILDPLCALFTGMIGWGIYPFVALLLVSALILINHDIKPYRLRVICVMLIPFLYSSIVQCIIIGDGLKMSFASIGELWVTGNSLTSAGVISGVLAIVAGAALSQTGAKIILSFILIVCVFTAINRTPWGLARSIRKLLEDDAPERLSEDDMTVSPRESTKPVEPEQPETASFWTVRRAKSKQKKALKAIEKAERAKAEAEKANRLLNNDTDTSDIAEPEEFPGDAAKRENSRRAIERQKKLDEVMPKSRQRHNFDPIVESDFEPESEPEKETPSRFPDIDRMMDSIADQIDTDYEAEQRKAKKAEKAAAAAAKKQVETEIATAMADTQIPPYLPPSLDLLDKPKREVGDSKADLDKRAAQLLDTLDSFGIEAQLYGKPIVGPTVTRFEILIERGVKISRITSLTDDIGLALGSPNVRLFMVPEHGAVGIEVANHKAQTVYIRDVLSSPEFQNSTASLPVALGKDIAGRARVIDIAKMPHLLIAGTTGSGKSVCINSLLVSLLFRLSREELRLIMIDPKMVELSNYNGIPHLLIPVVTDAKKASGALSWAVGEMERRYSLFAAEGVRQLKDYNDLMRRREEEELGTQQAQTAPEIEDDLPFDIDDEPPKQEAKPSKVLPRIVIVIDELADLMMVSGKEVEGYICRLAQKARAAGMYLVVATQRPSADVITGLMKSNIPSRIAFAVASSVESRIILDSTGAEKLVGHGDMLCHPLGANEPIRIQGCFINTDEIERVIAHVKTTGAVEYSEEIQNHIDSADGESTSGYDAAEDEDPMLNDAISVVVSSGQASTSMLQRKLKLGYARAARVMDQMEERGIVGPSEGSKPRRVLISKDDWMEIQLRRDI